MIGRLLGAVRQQAYQAVNTTLIELHFMAPSVPERR